MEITIDLLLPGENFSNKVTVRQGSTVEQLAAEKLPRGESLSNYRVNVNREPVTATYSLREGDRVVFAPNKVGGGC